MYIIESYGLAVAFCFVTMLCWGSWAITAKWTDSKWQFPLYYWDYSIGLVITALMYGLTMGSFGTEGRSLMADLNQASSNALLFALLGGAIFNLSNLLVVAAITISGIAIVFPVAVGLALVLGVVLNYLKMPQGDTILLFSGVALIVVAMIINALASARFGPQVSKSKHKGIIISVIAGVIMAFFYRFVAEGMATSFTSPDPGKLTPYSAVLVFSIGLFLSNFLWNTFFMYKPITGTVCTYRDYFTQGTTRQHLIGILGGIIFNTGFLFNLIASEKAGIAVSYGLGQGATIVGAALGVFVFKEFAQAPKTVNRYLIAMFLSFFIGLVCIILSKLSW